MGQRRPSQVGWGRQVVTALQVGGMTMAVCAQVPWRQMEANKCGDALTQLENLRGSYFEECKSEARRLICVLATRRGHKLGGTALVTPDLGAFAALGC